MLIMKSVPELLPRRLLKLIHHVARNQTCGVPPRFIVESVALLQEVVHYANDTDLPLAILSLDQEKAFVWVNWPFFQCTLLSMSFGPSFIKCMYLLHSDIQSFILVNGCTSCYFKPFCRVRQGCPLSPLSMF